MSNRACLRDPRRFFLPSLALLVLACGGNAPATTDSQAAANSSGGSSGGSVGGATDPGTAGAGNPEGQCAVPIEASPEDVSGSTNKVGDGSAASCTSSAVVSAVAKGGLITFDCGPEPITITLNETAKVFNDKGPKIVIDGGGKVTLSGGHAHRILYMNTCDEKQVFTTPHCDNQESPQLTLQNITLIDGNSKNETDYDGGGALWVRGGRLKLVNARFFGNECAASGQDVGGGAVRVFSQFNNLPVFVVGSTFGRADAGNLGSNGGALSSIGVSWTILNSNFVANRATGSGGNPKRDGTPGGGLGGAIYNDGNTINLTICGTSITGNRSTELAGALMFISNDLTGQVRIDRSKIQDNPGVDVQKYGGIYIEARDKQGNAGVNVTDSLVDAKK